MTIKAQIAQVNLGHIQIEGLLGSDGKFYVAVSQIADKFQTSRNTMSRDLQRLLGEAFKPSKATTIFNRAPVNILNLDDFQKVLMQLAFKGNVVAQKVLQDMSALGLHQLFCDAFNIRNTAEDRAAWLQQRIESKSLFWELTQQIKVWMEQRECSAPAFTYYANAFDCLNLQLFGKKAKEIREEVGIHSPNGLTRDHFGIVALRHIGIVQSGAARIMAEDECKPTEAIKEIFKVSRLHQIDYRD